MENYLCTHIRCRYRTYRQGLCCTSTRACTCVCTTLLVEASDLLVDAASYGTFCRSLPPGKNKTSNQASPANRGETMGIQPSASKWHAGRCHTFRGVYNLGWCC
ncbi:protein of unknown function [Moritella yayanosii]|uniref:Uncharacterized protein n=1 Tax=Moritella yayanosii TaxID=69539 RepID=A0A330LJ98_9GAMM|nr:protein of unknown function [Moritella yayanosii]